jgi:hypothetical protein
MKKIFENIWFSLSKNDWKYKINLEAIPYNKLSIIILERFFPPFTRYYKWETDSDYYMNNPNKKKSNIDKILYNLDWDYWIDKLIYYIKNIKIKEDELAIRDKLDSDISKYSWPDENGIYHPWNYIWETPHWTWVMNNPEYYTDEEISWVPYLWWWEWYEARSYKDITYVYDYVFWERVWEPEIYSTPEVLEVLEKWKEALEKWNNPEERQKMIEEYERNNGGKT